VVRRARDICASSTGGRARKTSPSVLRMPPSSLSRRLDRLEEEGWVRRHREVDPEDHRAVEIELTKRGRNLWREMNVTYRRSVQAHFATWLDDDAVDAVTATNATLAAVTD
jgi:DNA-binding MarR family transcriptional regulator